jgi:A/G-specific adenine glycosylase
MSFSQKILKWFDNHGRKDLPWQENITPYRVWVSEIMLQQTQVSTVIPYFLRFMKQFPTIQDLAKASLEEVLRLWSGLGYYARAKNLHNAAKIIQIEHQGIFPQNFLEVVNLPGIGRSTAGAILSISTQQKYPILDGNVKRVLSRYFAVEGLPNDKTVIEHLWHLSEQQTPSRRVHHYTQAIMDLGATLCTRTRPKCEDCPVSKDCQAKALNRVAEFPALKQKTEKPTKSIALLLVMDSEQKNVLLEKRPTKGIWGGLWSLPECPVKTDFKKWCPKNFNTAVTKTTAWPAFRHTFTHFHLEIHPIVCQSAAKNNTKLKALSNRRVNSNANFHWHPITQATTLGLPAPIKPLLEKLKKSAVKIKQKTTALT